MPADSEAPIFSSEVQRMGCPPRARIAASESRIWLRCESKHLRGRRRRWQGQAERTTRFQRAIDSTMEVEGPLWLPPKNPGRRISEAVIAGWMDGVLEKGRDTCGQ